MTLHREGYKILLGLFIVLTILNLAIFALAESPALRASFMVGSLIIFFLIAQFFRIPKRHATFGDEDLVCPADGKVVAIEKVFESEYLNREAIQVSIFMSPLNVHVNVSPVTGEVVYYKYHEGLYLVAWHPKSSTNNERTTVVARRADGKEILFRQIAGAVARRICCYVDKGSMVERAREFGFIKFGSRVDILLPTDSDIKVSIGDKVRGSETVLARLEMG